MATNSSLVRRGTILQSTEWKIVAGLFYVILFIVGTAGNLLVIYIFGWQKRGKRKTTEQLLLSLGICDLMTSVILAPMMAFMALYAGNDLALRYRMGCQIIPLVMTVSITVSQHIVILICYDRYRAIVTPLRESTCIALIRKGVIIAIIVGFALAIPMLLQSDNEQLKQEICIDYTEKGPLIIFQAAILVIRDIISFTVMAYFIRKMLIALRNSTSFRRALSSKASSKEASDFIKAKKILYSVLVLFVILIWPTDICFLGLFLYYSGDEYTSKTMALMLAIMTLIMLLQTVNSTVNVFIYSAIHPDFKKFLSKVKAFCYKPPSEEEDNSMHGTINLSFSQPRNG